MTHCNHPRHGSPCPQPCTACDEECKGLRIFILEDEIHSGGYEKRDRLKDVLKGHELTLALSVEEGIKKYVPGHYHLLILDHDMNGNFNPAGAPGTGIDFIHWLLKNEPTKPRPSVILHSMNEQGKKKMTELLEPEGYQVSSFRFDNKYLDFMRTTFGLAS